MAKNHPESNRLCRTRLIAAALAVLMTACAPPPPPAPTAAPTPAGFPAPYYQQAEAQGRKVLRVLPQQSLVTIEVGRAGSLARLGHDHVVASHDVNGYVAPEEGRADLYLPLERLTVDEPELRTAAGLDTQPPAAAIEGTRQNMLAKVLETERFPFALVHATRSGDGRPVLRVEIALHGATRSFEVPVEIQNLPDGMAVSGRLSFKQSDFGIAPFSVLNGALQVRDRLDLRFRIVAAEGRRRGR